MPAACVEPRIVHAGNERRLTGYAALPFNLNLHLRTFGDLVLASGTILLAAGAYDVFDSPSAARAGALTFRYCSTTGAAPRGAAHAQRAGGRLASVRASDAGSGVDPASLVVRIDGEERRASSAAGEVCIATAASARTPHARLQISDYQESRNMENVGRIPLQHPDPADDLHRPLSGFRAPGAPLAVPPAGGAAGHGLAAVILLLDRRELGEVALDALGELLLLGADHLEARLAPAPLALSTRVGTDDLAHGTTCGDHDRRSENQQHDPGPAWPARHRRPSQSYSCHIVLLAPAFAATVAALALPALAQAEERTLTFTTPG